MVWVCDDKTESKEIHKATSPIIHLEYDLKSDKVTVVTKTTMLYSFTF